MLPLFDVFFEEGRGLKNRRFEWTRATLPAFLRKEDHYCWTIGLGILSMQQMDLGPTQRVGTFTDRTVTPS